MLLGTSLALFALASVPPAKAADAAPAKSGSDVIVFTNGDQLTGTLLNENNGTVSFKSDAVGTVNVSWDKIKSLKTTQPFAALQQGQEVSRKTSAAAVPKGTIHVEDQQLSVNGAAPTPPVQLPVKNVQYLIDEATYNQQVFGHPGILHGWTGSVTAGATQIQATQNSKSFTTSATAVRTIPNVNWLPPRNRTTFDFNASYGSISEPNTPTTKTDIVHGDAEQDWYFSPRFYSLVNASFDHNYSQGLNLQQLYGAGFGYTALKTPKQELDVKADIHFERQTFGFTPGIVPPVVTPSKNLIGADVGDTYLLHLPHGMVFNESLVVTPAFNVPSAYSALLNTSLNFPVYKRFSFNLGALDDFLNDPAVGSKKNSFQYTAGLGYTF